MPITDKAQKYYKKMFPEYEPELLKTDPELIELFYNFAFDEVVAHEGIDGHTRFIVILATLVGSQSLDEFKSVLPAAMRFKVSAIEIKEIVYQAVAYLGIGRVSPFLHAANDFLMEKGITLPLEKQGTTTIENRLEMGIQAQVDIFGEVMRDFYKSGSEESKHINYWLASNCFGDYYTRNGLDHKQRELITFCFLAAQGGCEPQLKSHVAAKIRVGNDKSILISVISQCLPFIGYPRSLNALRCVEDVTTK